MKGSQTQLGQFKSATWYYPYKKFALEDPGEFVQEEAYFFCREGGTRNERDLYLKKRASIMNGDQTKELFDCKRGLRGDFVTLDDEPPGAPYRLWPSDPAKVNVDSVRPHSNGDLLYQAICLRVMHEKPYSPE